ncbi:MAG: YggS family pyridoxal phosphate-dependent enzyme [Actinomycetota bacterium]|nr:YggS family pyridoxal phosphate-dependent enzyme [Actinomycetota bacterium]
MTPPGTSAGGARTAELEAGLAVVEQRIARACADSGRSRSEITLVVVTKFFPASDVRLLQELGVRDIGESRAQEALAKHEALTSSPPPDPSRGPVALTRHFIGQVQTNKAAVVAQWADLVHTVDRPRLVHALARAAATAGTVSSVLVQVSLEPDDDPAQGERGGIAVAQAPALADLVADQPSLRLAGVMAVAPRDGDPDEAFARLAEVSRDIRAAHPDAVIVSAGMSGDLEAAVRHGATHLRVGSAILGSRPAVR